MKKKIKKKKFDLTPLLHITIVALLITIVWGFYNIAAEKDVNNLVKNANNIYQEKIEDTQKLKKENLQPAKQLKPFKKYAFKYTYLINVQGNAKNINFKLQIPTDENEKQYIQNLKITPSPVRTYHDGVNNVAEFSFNNINSGQIQITVEGLAKVRTYDLKTAQILNKNLSPKEDLSRYLKEERLIESNDSTIKRIAKSIKGETPEQIAVNVYNYTQNTLNYEPIPRDIGAKEALRQKKGKCSEFSAVMTAILRAKQIPARIISGNIAREENQKHSWVEVYFDRYGWVQFDPTNEATVVNIYHNGKLLRQEKRSNSDKNNLRYIASSRNLFSSWFITYAMYEHQQARISVSDKIEIKSAE